MIYIFTDSFSKSIYLIIVRLARLNFYWPFFYYKLGHLFLQFVNLTFQICYLDSQSHIFLLKLFVIGLVQHFFKENAWIFNIFAGHRVQIGNHSK